MALELKRLDGGLAPIDADTLQAFKAGFKGAVLTADDPAY